MPIQMASYLVPKNGGQFFLVEDTYIKGGYHAVADVAARDALFSNVLKSGTLCHTADEDKYYRYDLSTTSWVEIPLGVAGPTGPTGPSGSGGGSVANSLIDGTLLYKNTYTNTSAFPTASTCPGSTVTAADTKKVYVSNGTSWLEVKTSIPYDIALSVYGQPSTANDLLASYIAARTVNIAAGTSGVAVCGTAPSTTIALILAVNGTQVGTVSYSSGSTVGIVSIASAITLTAGQTLTLKNPATADTQIEDISITIAGTC